MKELINSCSSDEPSYEHDKLDLTSNSLDNAFGEDLNDITLFKLPVQSETITNNVNQETGNNVTAIQNNKVDKSD